MSLIMNYGKSVNYDMNAVLWCFLASLALSCAFYPSHRRGILLYSRKYSICGRYSTLLNTGNDPRLHSPNLRDDPDVDVESRYINQQSGNVQEKNSLLLLNSVAVLFGSQHAVIKSALDVFPSPSIVNLWRFFSSALLFSPALISLLREYPKERDASIWKAGAELGLYTFLGFAFQAIGMETTSASKSAFILYLNVKFVPFLGYILFRKQIGALTWISALLAFFGTYLLSSDRSGIVVGDLWSIAAAAASAMFILRLESFSKNFDAGRLNAVNFSVVAFLCLLWAAADLQDNALVMEDIYGPIIAHPFPIVYLGVITTALCNYLQTLGQRSVSAEKAAIIYSMDPVYGAIFSNILLGEQLGLNGWIGAAFILSGVWLSSQLIPGQDERTA